MPQSMGTRSAAVEEVLQHLMDRRSVLRGAVGLSLAGGISGLLTTCSADDGDGTAPFATSLAQSTGSASAPVPTSMNPATSTTVAAVTTTESTGPSTTMALPSDLWSLSLEEVARLVADKQLSPVELAELALDRITRVDPHLDAFITVTPDLAMAQARAAEQAIMAGNDLSPLHGVPIAYKDVFDTAGVLTTAGSKVFADRVPAEDAAVVTALANAGAVTLGKLNLLEFAAALAGINPHFGATHNPWDLSMFSGGSSSGSGAATAAGLVYGAMGTDTGGSVRLPAAFCGVVGLMPTFGRVSMRGVFSGTATFDHAGPIARTVRDTAVMLRVISGVDRRDPNTLDVVVPDYLAGIERGAGGVRIGLPRDDFWRNLDPEIEAAVQRALDAMAGAGAELREVVYPNVNRYLGALTDVSIIEAMEVHAPTFPSRRSDYGTDVAALLDLYRGRSESALRQLRSDGLAVIAAARGGEADAALDGVDVLAVPTSKRPVFSIAEAQAKYDQGDYGYTAVEARFDNTMVFDATGQPAISVPCGFTSTGMPIGLMLIARRWDEVMLLRAARAYEHVRGAFPMPPI